ncbi:MAG TPA: hypothetical protein VG266_03935 [Candidatus Dormibacteraeota bacterium]|nr:hypothetical protein [Candidatus Dormibacteraeota bacterium]
MSSPYGGPPPLRDYEVLQPISTRAGVTMYAGRQRFTGQSVALLLLDPALAASDHLLGARLVAAARRASQVNDPAVVATYDVIEEPGALGVVTEPVDGAWLDELIRPGSPLPPAAALVVIDAVLSALEAAHRGGLVHGGVAAGAVLVTPGGQPRLGGFATSAALPGGVDADTANDLLATATLAHLLLTGAPPSPEGNIAAPTVAGVGDVLARALAADPQARYQSAADFRAALLGVAFTGLGPAWRLSSDLADRVAAAAARRGPAAAQPATPSRAASPVGPAAAAAVAAALGAERSGAPGAEDKPPVSGPVPGFRTPPPPGSAVLAGAAAPPLAMAPSDPPSSYLPPPPPRLPVHPAAPEPSGRRRSTIVLMVAGAVLVLGGIATAVVFLLTRNSTSGPLTVGTDVKLEVNKVSGSNCDNTFNFVATGSLSGSGTLTYHFERSDQQRTDDMKVQIDNNPGFEFRTAWRFIGQRTGKQTMTFVVTSPTTRQVNKDIDVTCP